MVKIVTTVRNSADDNRRIAPHIATMLLDYTYRTGTIVVCLNLEVDIHNRTAQCIAVVGPCPCFIVIVVGASVQDKNKNRINREGEIADRRWRQRFHINGAKAGAPGECIVAN